MIINNHFYAIMDIADRLNNELLNQTFAHERQYREELDSDEK